MTNPNNSVGTNGAYGGRTSVNAFNDVLGAFTSGILSGWSCSPDSGLTVILGGNGTTRDVAIAEDNAGNKTTINNISGSPISVTIPAAPASNSRIDLIVAYVDNPPEGVSTTADNPGACGLIVVSGTPASTPISPDDNTIRTAITGDGASGANAYYVILAEITIASGTTTLTSSNIAQGLSATLRTNAIEDGSITNEKLATVLGNYTLNEVDTGCTWVDGSKIYKKTINTGTMPDSTTKYVAHGITNLKRIIQTDGYAYRSSMNDCCPLPFTSPNVASSISISSNDTNIIISAGIDRSAFSESYVTLYYTKIS